MSAKRRRARRSGNSTALFGAGGRLHERWVALPRSVHWLCGAVVLVALAALPLHKIPYLDTPKIDFGTVLAEFTVVALLAIGINLVVGQAGRLDLGYIGFFAVGAYSAALLTSPESSWRRAGGLFTSHWAWLTCAVIGMLLAAVCALVIGVPTLKLRGEYLAIATVCFGEAVRLTLGNLKITEAPQGLAGAEFRHSGDGYDPGGGLVGHVSFPVWWYWVGLAAIAVVLLVTGNLERSRIGRAWGAIRDDETAAEHAGVPTFRFKLWALLTGAAIGGLSGAVYAGQAQYVAPARFDVLGIVLVLCAVVLGGRGNKIGAVAVAFFVVYIPARLTGIEVGGVDLGELKYLLAGLVLLLFLIFRPVGLFPMRPQLLVHPRGRKEAAAVEVKPRASRKKKSAAAEESGEPEEESDEAPEEEQEGASDETSAAEEEPDAEESDEGAEDEEAADHDGDDEAADHDDQDDDDQDDDDQDHDEAVEYDEAAEHDDEAEAPEDEPPSVAVQRRGRHTMPDDEDEESAASEPDGSEPAQDEDVEHEAAKDKA